jgi:hypothetical protein
MSVFLRWGIFGILAFAGLMYAYNASKRMAEQRQSRPAATVSAGPEAISQSNESTPSGVEVVTQACQEELQVAELAIQARRDGEPLDRLLRNQVIAFQSEAKRRERLEAVARKWFGWVGAEPDARTLRETALRDCWKFSPAP